MSRKWKLFASLVVLAGTGIPACKKNPPTTVASAQPVRAAGAAETAVVPPASAQAGRDVEPAVLSEDLATLNRKGYLVDAFFDFQSADLRDDARATLAKDAQWLNRFPSIEVLLEGHCDERGTEAYNLALGEQRAYQVREYLISLGISRERIRTVSYGQERPFCTGDDEHCWQENRRAHVLVTAK